MGEQLVVAPRVNAVLEHRKAASGCCGAKLSPGAAAGSFTCRGCGEPCERVLGEPRVVTAHA